MPEDGQKHIAQGLTVVRALERGISLLRAFSQVEPRLSLATIARRTALDKGTARRLLYTLARSGLVEMDPHTGEYFLTADVLALGAAVETGREVRTVAAPFLANLAKHTGATAFLWILHDDTALCVDQVCAPVSAIKISWSEVGARLALNLGAGPRALLSWCDDDTRERVLAGPLDRRTVASQVDVAILRSEVKEIHQAGWVLATDDFVLGLSALGVPVFDALGNLAGAMSITNISQMIVDDGQPRHLDLLRHAAAEISRQLI